MFSFFYDFPAPIFDTKQHLITIIRSQYSLILIQFGTTGYGLSWPSLL